MINEIHFIKQVEINGLWNNTDILWNLNPDVNILAGGNGSGKTTLLDSICSLMTIGTLYDERRGILEKVIIFFDNQKHINFEHLKVKDILKNIERKAQRESKYKEVISKIKAEEGENYKRIKSVSVEIGITSFDDLGITLEEFHQQLTIEVISTFDNSLNSSEDIKKLSDDRVRTELDRQIYLLQKQYLDYQLNLSKRKDRVVENTDNPKEELAKLKYPHERFLAMIDELFAETHKKVNRSKNEISFLLNDKKEIQTHQLSSGEKQLLLILLTTLVQDQKPSIFFMDEPEISLHIDWQRKLIGFIRELNPNAQLIIATHSPDIIMEGWLDRVFEINDIIKPKTLSK
ncbi:MAG: ATP-binding cassette domain-containing protein [Bacteroidetes bacterium]|nr:MAG: ATP-binding cassette domain-containing protein [Bacteroidota bacterium]